MAPDSRRGTSSVVGVVLMVGVAVLASGAVAVAVTGVDLAGSPPRAVLDATADADADRVSITHVAGDPLPMAAVSLRVSVDGRALSHQPPVPFFAAAGFRAGPTGPFNAGGDGTWHVGETGSFRLASTNDPTLTEGATVEVVVATDRAVLARVRARAE